MNQENNYKLDESIFTILGCALHERTDEPMVWVWDEQCKKSTQRILKIYEIDLLNPKLPEGCYATKEECEKANRKTIKVAIYRKDTRIVEVDVDTFDEAQDWVDAHIKDIFDDGEEMNYMVEEVTD